MAPSNADDPTRSLAPGKRPDAPPPRRAFDAAGWEERLLGFDARVTAAGTWPAERRTAFLLRPDAAQPRSTDAHVWPSLFDEPGQSRPAYVGFFGDLWEDLALLQLHVATSNVSTPPVIVAVSVQARETGWTGRSPLAPVLGGRVFDAFSGLPLPLPYTRPSTRDAHWPLLGFDVADTGGRSGIARCRYDIAFESEALQTKFGALLNDYHLFDQPDDADEFRALCDTRLPEHAPFFVYGLWLIA